jgi:single-stranded-DNA-specific exonuclease
MNTIWKPKKINKAIYDKFVELGKSPLTAAIIATRNYEIESKQELSHFIKNDLNGIESYTIIPHINDAIKLLEETPENVLVFGDYDVDGTMSVYMFKTLMRELGSTNIQNYIPDRAKDGYGLNYKSVKNLIAKHGDEDFDLITMLDCGTNSYEQIEILKEHYPMAKIMVIDHHLVNKSHYASNADAVVNYRLNPDGKTPYCTGGLVYQLARGCEEHYGVSAKEYLVYGAIATVADVCDLETNNRMIVGNGLASLKDCENMGLAELVRICEIDVYNCNTTDVGFQIAPRINACGRMDHASGIIDLLESEDIQDASDKAHRIDLLNTKRKRIQEKMLKSALDQLGSFDDKESILLYNEKWNASIAGIVAGRLCSKFHVPTIVLGNSNGKLKGSARSINGVNIVKAMDKISDCFVSYGGHEMAAGAELKKEFEHSAWELFDQAVQEIKEESGVEGVTVYYDVKLKKPTFESIKSKFANALEKFQPFGRMNERPIFRVDNVKCVNVKEWSSNKGAFVTLENCKLDVFIYEENASRKIRNKNIDILFEVNENFKDDEDWAIIIKEWKIHED